MKNKSLFFGICFVLTVCSSKIYSQSFSSPIHPGTEERNKIIGGLIGFGQNMQSGIAFVSCDSCEFANGLAFGYTVGATYEEQLSANDESIFYYFNFGGLLHLSNRNVSSSYRERTPQYFSEYDITFPLMFRHTNKTSITTAGLMPFIRFNPMKYFFVKFGFDISYVTGSNVKHEIELLERRKTLPNGEVVDVHITTSNPNRKTYSRTVQDSEIKDINNLQMSLVPAIGGNIYFTDKLFMTPSFHYFKALNNMSEFGKDFRIDAWRLNVELKYNITTSNKIYKRKATNDKQRPRNPRTTR
jgi:hypothetical protein